MRITSVETIVLRQSEVRAVNDSTQDALVVRVETDAGITGLGEVDSSPEVIQAIIHAPRSHRICRGLASVLIGENPLDVELLWQKMYRASVWFGRRSAVIHAISGLDIALWDIKGKALNLPIYQLLGGAHRLEIPAYASVLMPETPELVAAEVTRWRNEGFSALKLGWGPLGVDLEHNVALMTAAREAAGEQMEVMIDLGFYPGPDLDTGWDASRVLDFARHIEPHRPFWLEEVLPPDDLQGLARIASGTSIRIAAGENCTTRYEFSDLLARGVSVVQPDVTRAGGFTECRRIAAIAEEYGVPCVPHAWSTGIIKAASMHLVAAIPNALYLEYCTADTPLNRALVSNPVRLDQGYARVPTGPGLGIELDLTTLEKFTVARASTS